MGARDDQPSGWGWARFWFLTAVAVVVGLMLVGGAVIAAQGRLLGGDDGADCMTNPAAVGAVVSEEVGVSVTPSYWPLGTDCTLSSPSGQHVTISEADWAMTAVAMIGAALAVAPVALLPLTRRSASRSPVR